MPTARDEIRPELERFERQRGRLAVQGNPATVSNAMVPRTTTPTDPAAMPMIAADEAAGDAPVLVEP